ncbi:hypothetical protein O1L60_37395 [Streptomyces diastatochromogenes]|nr:hypothetical protein [Streptomyces diastatochromogenes]
MGPAPRPRRGQRGPHRRAPRPRDASAPGGGRRGGGLDLLPGIGDLEAECGCEAWDHCPHTAALCYQVARLLDEDPFVLLLMRGAASAPSWTSCRRAAPHGRRAVRAGRGGGG